MSEEKKKPIEVEATTNIKKIIHAFIDAATQSYNTYDTMAKGKAMQFVLSGAVNEKVASAGYHAKAVQYKECADNARQMSHEIDVHIQKLLGELRDERLNAEAYE